jgi:hypothetical protein
LHRKGAADKNLVVPQEHPIPFELVVVTVASENAPGFFKGNVFKALQKFIGNVWPAIRKSFSLPFGGECNDLVFRECDLLRVRRNEREDKNRREIEFLHDKSGIE